MGTSVQALPAGWTTVPAWPVGLTPIENGVSYGPAASDDDALVIRAAG